MKPKKTKAFEKQKLKFKTKKRSWTFSPWNCEHLYPNVHSWKPTAQLLLRRQQGRDEQRPVVPGESNLKLVQEVHYVRLGIHGGAGGGFEYVFQVI